MHQIFCEATKLGCDKRVMGLRVVDISFGMDTVDEDEIALLRNIGMGELDFHSGSVQLNCSIEVYLEDHFGATDA